MTTAQLEKRDFHFTPTQDWFSGNVQSWTNLFPLVPDKPRILEIGSWEGRSAVFLLDNLCKDGGSIVCIDHFDLFQTPAGRERFERIQHNLSLTKKDFRVVAAFSVPGLMTVLKEEITSASPGFDWIYIDGSHEADDTMLDGELAWRLARKGAVVIFDDYHWDKEPEDSIHHPKRGIDTFLVLHQGEYERFTDDNCYQVVLRKLTEMRIGFLVDEKVDSGLDEALGYGIHIALTVDSAYAIGAAVGIRSAVENTPGRITFYVVDCGMSTDDKEKLQKSLPERNDVTVVFLSLPEDGLTVKLGSTVWAKLDMCSILPVERVLYLDADVLVRASLKTLWDSDLEGKALGAALDVGHPLGHDKLHGKPYFNAGVMLMDLAKVRLGIKALEDVGKEMKDSVFKDQDALNIHFSDWKKISLEWNAQGLGTYAKHLSEDRRILQLEQMSNPGIVHFTGPLFPSLADVLNPFVQPPISKPWGYMRASGHPFQKEWEQVVERTAWAGYANSETWKMLKVKETDAAIAKATEKFRSLLS